jgi:hypothetical protein
MFKCAFFNYFIFNLLNLFGWCLFSFSFFFFLFLLFGCISLNPTLFAPLLSGRCQSHFRRAAVWQAVLFCDWISFFLCFFFFFFVVVVFAHCRIFFQFICVATEQYPQGLGKLAAEIGMPADVDVVAKTTFTMMVPEIREQINKLPADRRPTSVVLFGIEVSRTKNQLIDSF